MSEVNIFLLNWRASQSIVNEPIEVQRDVLKWLMESSMDETIHRMKCELVIKHYSASDHDRYLPIITHWLAHQKD
jgi:hypothetical protein